MAESIERYLRLMPVGRRLRPSARLWCPAADVYRVPDGWIVKVELAGVRADEVEITIAGTTLSIIGCRRDTFYREGVQLHQLEITYSRFEKVLQFPCAIEGARVESDYRDGLLMLHLQSRGECEAEDSSI